MMFEEYKILTEKLTKIVPFEAFPIRGLVAQVRDKMPITMKSKLRVDSVFNSNDVGGIICTILIGNEVLACGLTHLIIPPDNPLFKEIKQYQEKRIARLKRLDQGQ
jgi:hypothetical protein